jgi:hypothetical protein
MSACGQFVPSATQFELPWLAQQKSFCVLQLFGVPPQCTTPG